MLDFIKMFGFGVLYTVLSPLILLVYALLDLFALGNYFVHEVINLVGFFAGKRFTTDTELDVKLKKIRAEKEALAAKAKDGELHV